LWPADAGDQVASNNQQLGSSEQSEDILFFFFARGSGKDKKPSLGKSQVDGFCGNKSVDAVCFVIRGKPAVFFSILS
jgi:hypothetical protein